MGDSIVLGNLFSLLLSFVIMCCTTYTMLSIIEQNIDRPYKRKLQWMVGASVIFGLGQWTMHMTAILESSEMLVMNGMAVISFPGGMLATFAALLTISCKKRLDTSNWFSVDLLGIVAFALMVGVFLFQFRAVSEANLYIYMQYIVISFIGVYTAFCLYQGGLHKYKMTSSVFIAIVTVALNEFFKKMIGVGSGENSDLKFTDYYLFILAVILCMATLFIIGISFFLWFNIRKNIQMDERYKLLVENSMDTIALIRQGKWEYMNPAGLGMFEANNEKELINHSIYNLLHEQHHEEMKHSIGNAGDEIKVALPVELRWRTLKGNMLDTEMVLVRTMYFGSQIDQVILRNISERKKNEEKLINSEKLAIAGQLAAGVAHEIRNPLTTLKGFFQLIETGRISSNSYFPIMKSELDHIEYIVSELLMLSKPQAYEYSAVDIRQLLLDTSKLLKDEASLNNVTLTNLSENIPIRIRGVEIQMKQVFMNVLKNAIDSMQHGGVATIKLSQDDEEHAVIRISDEGSGISEEQLAKIGQPFYTTKDRGTGLGLMVAYRIVENHNGEITVESEIGRGTIFTIRLPLLAPNKDLTSNYVI